MAGDMVLGIQNEQALAEGRCYDSGRKVVISSRGALEDLQCMPRILRYVQWDNLALEFTEPLGLLIAFQRLVAHSGAGQSKLGDRARPRILSLGNGLVCYFLRLANLSRVSSRF
jgi:hypothetical protein